MGVNLIKGGVGALTNVTSMLKKKGDGIELKLKKEQWEKKRKENFKEVSLFCMNPFIG